MWWVQCIKQINLWDERVRERIHISKFELHLFYAKPVSVPLLPTASSGPAPSAAGEITSARSGRRSGAGGWRSAPGAPGSGSPWTRRGKRPEEEEEESERRRTPTSSPCKKSRTKTRTKQAYQDLDGGNGMM